MNPRVLVTPDGAVYLVSSRDRVYRYREVETGMLCGRRVDVLPVDACEVFLEDSHWRVAAYGRRRR